MAQDNSPYSRYGLGDASPSTNISSRGMGGISAGYADFVSINFNNPASYAAFQAIPDPRSHKLAAGRAILDVGMNFDNRTLLVPNSTSRFTSADAFFSYLQVGVPLRKNWGLAFGLRPISRISYNISRSERLTDPVTGNAIDSAYTQFKGSGGSYLPTIGTGFGTDHFSAGFNVGYLFGSRQSTTLRSLINDSVQYNASDFSTTTSFGNLFFNAGLQYRIDLKKTKDRYSMLRLGVSGNWQQDINASQDILRQTYTLGTAGEELQLDSVSHLTDVKGKIVYPASYKGGFVMQQVNYRDNSGWLFGADYTTSKWSNYRYFGQQDSVQDSWMVNIGGQIYGKPRASLFTRITYRFGFYFGQDYIKVDNQMPVLGGSLGFGIPFGGYNRINPGQTSILNLSLEYGKRGNNDNLLRENQFRISVGFSLTDYWFRKSKYE